MWLSCCKVNIALTLELNSAQKYALAHDLYLDLYDLFFVETECIFQF